MKKKYIPLAFICCEFEAEKIMAASNEIKYTSTPGDNKKEILSKGSNMLEFSFDDSGED